VLDDAALVEDDVLGWVDTGCKEGCRHLPRCLHEFSRLLPQRDRVQIDDAVNAVMRVLELDEAPNGAEIVAEMQIAGWLHAGEDKLCETGHRVPRGLWRAVASNERGRERSRASCMVGRFAKIAWGLWRTRLHRSRAITNAGILAIFKFS
jgi:hypothetical protein